MTVERPIFMYVVISAYGTVFNFNINSFLRSVIISIMEVYFLEKLEFKVLLESKTLSQYYPHLVLGTSARSRSRPEFYGGSRPTTGGDTKNKTASNPW